MEDSVRRNALRNLARKCNAEVVKATKGKTAKKAQEIMLPIFAKYDEQAKSIGYTHLDLLSTMGLLNGVFGIRRDE